MQVRAVTVAAGEIGGLTSLNDLLLYNVANVATQVDYPATIRTIQYENNLNAAALDSILAGIWADRMAFTYATPSLDIAGGGNGTPGGVYQAQCPPTTGLEMAFELVNDSCGGGFNQWTVTYTP